MISGTVQCDPCHIVFSVVRRTGVVLICQHAKHIGAIEGLFRG